MKTKAMTQTLLDAYYYTHAVFKYLRSTRIFWCTINMYIGQWYRFISLYINLPFLQKPINIYKAIQWYHVHTYSISHFANLFGVKIVSE